MSFDLGDNCIPNLPLTMKGVPATPRYSSEIVVLKVEDRLFRVARQELVKESPVFESMFSLPDGEAIEHGRREGQTDKSPILLEGYKADDFEALLRLLYPTFDDVIKGTFVMSKSEWIGVLKLSTAWGMHKIRKHAISTLSTPRFALTPIDKISLARQYDVEAWLEDGLTSLVVGELGVSTDELEAAVGLRTAYRIVVLRSNARTQTTLRPCSIGGSFMPTLHLNQLKCSSCNTPPFNFDSVCHSCQAPVPLREQGHVVIRPSAESLVVSSASNVSYEVELRDLLCVKCEGRLVGPSINCASCHVVTLETGYFRVILGTPGPGPQYERDEIRKAFYEEFRDFEESD